MTTRRKTSPCKSCAAPMWWVTNSATGKKMPLDPEPHEKGNVVVDHALFATTLGPLGVIEARENDPDVELFLSHHATCPSGRQWRKEH